jgi:hypothetical protein
VCEGVRKGRECGLKRTGPREEGAVRREDPRDDDERLFGPYEGGVSPGRRMRTALYWTMYMKKKRGYYWCE